MTLAKQLGMKVPKDVIFLSAWEKPGTWRGFVFLALALVGLVKFALNWKTKEPATLQA